MKVAVFGLGYVGAVTAAVLAELGHTVCGVDVNAEKVARFNAGHAAFPEPELDDLIAAGRAAERLVATGDPARALRAARISLVCVGTPATATGDVNLGAVTRVLEQIGAGLRGSGTYHVVALRSTVPPVALPDLIAVLEAVAGRPVGEELGFCVNPEFLREGTAVADVQQPSFTLIGAHDARAGGYLMGLYQQLDAPTVTTDCKTALLVKYVSNAWHALKVAFANEVGDIAAALGISGGGVMEIFTQDTALNLSAAYLRPGEPYGGSCLPKDLAALLRMTTVRTPVLAAAPRSNADRVRRAVDAVLRTGAQRVVMVGLSFKRGTADLRSSPAVLVVERLLEAGREVQIYDPDVPPGAAGRYGVRMVQSLMAAGYWCECMFLAKPELLGEDDPRPELVLTWGVG
jgi:GDP-mannose 6-dehydrogenase